jgi:hypothetical protein
MAHRWNKLDKIFAAGIVWDPEEPLPDELQPQDSVDGYYNFAGRSGPGLQTQLFKLPGQHPEGFTVHRDREIPPIQQPVRVAATWPVAGGVPGRKLPSFTVQQQGRHLLPPLSVTVASIVQDTARVSVSQLFWNDSGVPIKEAAFTFPLPSGCTVTDFSCRIGTNKIIRGAVKPREEARNAFKQHIRTHETAAGLLEQDTPEIFTTTLGNVPEKTKVKVNLTYIAVLKHRFADSRNVTTLTLPTSIAPRYGETPEEYNDAASTNVPRGLTLDIEIVESENITSVDSPSHAITVTRRRGARDAESFADLAGEGDRSMIETASVKLETGHIFLDKDFVLDIVTAPDGGTENAQAWLEEHPTFANHKTLMLTLPPKFLARNAPPMQRSEILFLADRSGSMRDKIVALRSAMQFFLKGIPEGRKFNIWSFGSQYTSWQPQSVDYTEQTLNSALSWVATDLNANMGGTELLPAIQAIVDARDRALMTDVIILTDGQTWRMEQTLDYIQKTYGLTEARVRFFALGIGRAVSHALVDGIAKAGGGYADVVQEASQGGWEDRVVSMAKAALMSAHLGPLHLSFNIEDETGNTRSEYLTNHMASEYVLTPLAGSTLADAKRSPADTSAISPFDRSRLYFHLDHLNEAESIKSVTVEVQANQETTTLVIPVTVLEKRDTTLHKLAARSMLDDLERGRSHIHLGPNRPVPGSQGETIMVRKEAEGLACKWSLVSKWTSFFLAEEPYTPTGEDAFMDGVVEIKVSPADDLLQPRGTVQHIAALEPPQPGNPPNLEMRMRAIARPQKMTPGARKGRTNSASQHRIAGLVGSVGSIRAIGDADAAIPSLRPAPQPSPFRPTGQPPTYAGRPSIPPTTTRGTDDDILERSSDFADVSTFSTAFRVPAPHETQPVPPPPFGGHIGWSSSETRSSFISPPPRPPRSPASAGRPRAVADPSGSQQYFSVPPRPPSRTLQSAEPEAAQSGTHPIYYPNWSPDRQPMMSCNREVSSVSADSIPGTARPWVSLSSRRREEDMTTGEPAMPMMSSNRETSSVPTDSIAGAALPWVSLSSRSREEDMTARERLPESSRFELSLDAATLLGSREDKGTDPAVPPTVVDSHSFPAYSVDPGSTNLSSAVDSSNALGWTEGITRQLSSEMVQSTYTPPSGDTYGEGVGISSYGGPEDDFALQHLPQSAVYRTSTSSSALEADNGRHQDRDRLRSDEYELVRRALKSRRRGKSPGQLMHLAGGRERSEERRRDGGCSDIPQAAASGDAGLIRRGVNKTDVEWCANSSSRFDMDIDLASTTFSVARALSDSEDSESHNISSSQPRRCREVQPDTSATRGVGDSNANPKGPRKPSESDFIRTLLGYQQFDGSIDFGAWAVAKLVLGKDVSDALRALQQTYPDLTDRAAWTMAVCVLLERDFQSSKSLWELMTIKMKSYCEKLPLPPTSELGSNLLHVVAKGLAGLKSPVEQEKKARPSLWDRLRAPRLSDSDRSKGSKRKNVVDDSGGMDDASPEGSTESGAANKRSSVVVDTEMKDVLDEQPEAEPARPVV